MERPDLGTDLQLMQRPGIGGSLRFVSVGGDLTTVSGLDNLSQAIWLRLSVPMGDLTHLGHPDFGCRLHLLIGRLPNASTLALATAYVREALRRETRIAEVLQVNVKPVPGPFGTLLIDATVRPIGGADPIDLSMTFALEPGQGGGDET